CALPILSRMCSALATCTEPSNIRCSKRWANPVRPSGSWREPTSYQRLTATTGALWSGLTVTRRPFSKRVVSIGQGYPFGDIPPTLSDRRPDSSDTAVTVVSGCPTDGAGGRAKEPRIRYARRHGAVVSMVWEAGPGAGDSAVI